MLQIKNIHKEYKTRALVQKALDGVSLNLRDNEFVAILGPSGSGKTTLLNIIGGLDRYDRGDLIINGISTKKYKDRDWDSYRNHTIGFVFQSYNLIPHQTILANVELALTISGISKSERRQRATKALEQVGLGNQGHKKPNQMSGGQMQRVAIARALVNDPDILLADEPTGALDSETSVQVMELLKAVAKDRLVVMVTHNPELAQTYANRIVNLRDGVIISDTNSFPVGDGELEIPRHENMGKSAMSFMTSLVLSFNNLKTKKARTLLTSFAGSIGIIGIAMILSLSNGVNRYIKTIEEDTLSQYPLEIQSTGFDLSSIMNASQNTGTEDGDQTAQIGVTKMLTNMFSRIGSNDLALLKEFFEGGGNGIYDFVNSIDYNYDITPQIYSSDTSSVRQVNPDQSFSAMGMGSGASSGGFLSSMFSNDSFFQLPGNEDLYVDQYDIKAGKWPENYSECVLVLNEDGNISDFVMYTLGLRDASELDTMISQYLNEENVIVPDQSESFGYENILNTEFKLVNATDYYQYDQDYGIYTDKTDDEGYMKNLVENGETLEIVGIVAPVAGSTATMLQSGIGYQPSLTNHVIEAAASSDIVMAQLENPDIDVFTGKGFNSEQENPLDITKLFSIDPTAVQNAFSFDQSKVAFSADDFDFSQIQIDPAAIPAIDFEEIFSGIEISPDPDQWTELSSKLTDQFQQYMVDNEMDDPESINDYFITYIQSEDAQSMIQEEIAQFMATSSLTEEFQTGLENQMATIMAEYSQTIASSLQQQIGAMMETQMGDLAANIQDAISIDTDMFSKAITMNMSEDDLAVLMTSLMGTTTTSYNGNLSSLGYADLDQPDSISIYPRDFQSKQTVIGILDDYNAAMEVSDVSKVITYTDYVGTLMSSVTDIINVISYVLIAFVAISLVVSSIMIGVITYISVLERKKEIGILRAIGASKRNISQVFNAETFIIGLLAGLLGIFITLILLIPSNMVIDHFAGDVEVSAALPVAGAIILIGLSVILTIIGGLIPAKKAAQADPVTALRTD